MRYLVFIMALLSASASAAQSASHVSEQGSSLEAVDQEMIELLQLRDDQIAGYLKVIRAQRKALGGLSGSQWKKQLSLYKGTIDMLRPVLNEIQLAKFSAYLGCLIVDREYDTQVSMEANEVGEVNQELPSDGIDSRDNARTQTNRQSPESSVSGFRSEPAYAGNKVNWYVQ